MGGRHQTGQLQAAFLRGINVGGSRPLPMAELRELVSALGCAGVRSYIASGNLVFRPAGAAIGPAIEAAIADRYGYQVPVMTRDRDELEALVAANPFSESDGARYVGFCATAPGPDAIARIDPHRSPPDRFAAAGRELYFAYPNGRGRTRLSPDYIESALGIPITMRNWRTVTRVLALMREP